MQCLGRLLFNYFLVIDLRKRIESFKEIKLKFVIFSKRILIFFYESFCHGRIGNQEIFSKRLSLFTSVES